MTGYQSKKKAASAKTIDEVNWADHEPDGLTAAAFIAAEESKVRTRYGYVPKLHPSEYMQEQPAREPQTCKGRKCQASNENGFDHSPECIADTARDQGWSTAPPQRTWVGLTDEEGQRIVNSCQTGTSREIFRAIEQALKEKNNGA